MIRKIILILFISSGLYAQTGIGTTTPDASAKLEVNASDKGFLPPRVSLTALNSASPISSPANGLLVYNLASAGTSPNQVIPGYYYWNSSSSQWARLGNDNLGNHTASINIQLNDTYLSNDGGNEGIKIDNSGNVGIGTNTPTVPLDVNGGVKASALNLSNVSSTSSIILRNGDAAAAYNDNAQIKMGWAGSAAGTSQFAQYIHTRHNAGSTENAIDFYLSDGTANNTITSGSRRAMSISSPGNLDVAGKITFSDATGNVALKVSAFKSFGEYISMDNIKATVIVSNNHGGVSIAAVSTTFNALISGSYSMYNNVTGGSAANANQSISTIPTGMLFGWSFPTAGDTATFIITDNTNLRVYRLITQINYSFYSNFMSIERLL